MTVYSIGLLQGYLPNGVDNAQGYRERFFNDLCEMIIIYFLMHRLESIYIIMNLWEYLIIK